MWGWRERGSIGALAPTSVPPGSRRRRITFLRSRLRERTLEIEDAERGYGIQEAREEEILVLSRFGIPGLGAHRLDASLSERKVGVWELDLSDLQA